MDGSLNDIIIVSKLTTSVVSVSKRYFAVNAVESA